MIAAASPPLANTAIRITTPTTHNREVGGSANITTANTTSATNTPVSRTGLLPVGSVAVAILYTVIGPEVTGKEDNERVKEVIEVEMKACEEVFHHFPNLSSRMRVE